MKKRDEGYVLPFVLVVMVVLCLVAVSVMSFALRNLKNQQASVQRMQDQYAAQGEIEKVVAQIKSITSDADLGNICGENVTWKTEESADAKTLQVILTAHQGMVKIECVLNLKVSEGSIISTQTDGTKLYSLAQSKCTYKSYEISSVKGDGTG